MSNSIIVEPLQEPVDNHVDLDKLKLDLTPAAVPATPQVTEPEPEQEPALPDKFQNKSIKEVVDMYQNLEQEYGRKANEVGQQRQLLNMLEQKRVEDLSVNTPAGQPVPQADLPEIDASDLLDNPTETIRKVVEAATQSRVSPIETELAQTKFLMNHNDYQAVTADPDYVSWLSQSPYRQQLAMKVVGEKDWGAADSLLTEYKLHKQAFSTQPNPTDPTPQTSAVPDASAAVLESAHSSHGAVTPPQGKIVSRLALQRLRITDPEAYNDPVFQAEVLKAYQENRVK